MTQLVSAFVAFLFAVSAPVAIILGVGLQGGLTENDVDSWIFTAFVFNGVLSICVSIAYRQPLVFLWSIPGAILVGAALQSLSFDEVIGAYVLTGFLLILLGLTGWVNLVMNWVPKPVVMGMVAGVFMDFCIDWLQAFGNNLWLVGSMSAVFFLLSVEGKLTRFFSPMICAFLVGVLVMVLQGHDITGGLGERQIYAVPQTYSPVFSFEAAVALVIPLTITVIAAQNAQGIAVLRAVGHNPPVNLITSSCGIFSVLCALYGSVSTCLTGPVNAILVSNGSRNSQWAAAVILGLFAVSFGVFAPIFTDFLTATPKEFLATLAGLALLKTLQTSFETTFGPSFPFGGMISFLVTLSGLPIMNIGAPFWGMFFGVIGSQILERKSFTSQ